MSDLVHGWGLVPASACRLRRPDSAPVVAAMLAEAPGRGVIARGLGRSYGDAAQNAGGEVLELTALSRIGGIDPEGRVEVAAGTSLEELMAAALDDGWFVPVTPGTRQVTVGGAIAADIHGKNHHVDGSFGDHLASIELMTPDGSIHSLTPDGEGSELFWATVGGMGLTGMIVSAVIDLIPVDDATMLVDTDRIDDLDSLMAAMESDDDQYRYSVAWIDATAHGRGLGRGVLTRGDHAPGPPHTTDHPGPPWRPARLRVPLTPPVTPLRTTTIRAFNEVKFHSTPRTRRDERVGIGAFFHPLDQIEDWNRLYGPRGFVQHQFVVPPSGAEVVRMALERFSAASAPSFLAVLKRMGPANRGLLSFPAEGWTLALDIPAGVPGLAGMLDQLDELVLEAGGRVYLAKDARLDPRTFARMYPTVGTFRELRGRVDPHGLISSDLARRLQLA
ncbi:MAG: FAD-binding protein [Acidimicrobiales bacterium]